MPQYTTYCRAKQYDSVLLKSINILLVFSLTFLNNLCHDNEQMESKKPAIIIVACRGSSVAKPVTAFSEIKSEVHYCRRLEFYPRNDHLSCNL